MISPEQFAQRVNKKCEAAAGPEIPEELLGQIFGGCAPEDFCQSFHDSYVDGGIGPTFIDNFTDRFPFGNSNGIMTLSDP